MATIREQLKKITELYVPRAGDEREFVAKHRVEIFDKQGKDSISQETPYELILKNVAAIKAPPRAGEDHGHDAPGESEAAYHIPESRDAIIAKLSEMMGNEKDEDDEDEDEDEEEDEDEDEEEEDDEKDVKEAKKQVVGVEMHYTHATKKPFKITHFSAQDAERGKKDYEKMGYKLKGKKAQFGEAMDVTDYNPPSQGGTRKELLAKLKQTKDPKHAEAARKAGATQDELKSAMKEEMKPLLPKQKAVAADILKKEMEKKKQERLAAKQAGTMKEEAPDAEVEVSRRRMGEMLKKVIHNT
jgi:hypothetical protein